MSVTDQYGLTVYGEAILSYGLEVRDGVDGFGLLTRGMVWECPNIWVNGGASLTTTWSQAASGISVTTNWSQAASGVSITTAWSASSGSIWGEC